MVKLLYNCIYTNEPITECDMNERIRELAEVASKDNSDGYPVTLEYSNRFAEKFAELIVRECAKMADMPCDKVILEHFGVE